MAVKLKSSVTSALKQQLNGIKRYFAKLKTITTKFCQAVNKQIQALIKLFIKKPSEKSDYVKLGSTYLSKRFLAISFIVAIVVSVLFVQFLYPWADGTLWTATVKMNTVKYSQFSGKAKVKDNDGKVIYVGEMSGGHIAGQGKQYDTNGNLVYTGGFEKEEYSGLGKLYQNGVIIYDGQFAKNNYEGQGTQYNSEGKLVYVGNFAVGQRSGSGVEYNPNTGLKLYKGEFVNDLREGKGVLYDESGTTVVYNGNFAGGEFSGQGKLMENGILRYQGDFVNGLYEGQGTFYDTTTNKMIYQGEFKTGLYDGQGSLYDANTSKLVYKGEFTSGRRSGEGESYDKLGKVSFSGEFREDNINYLSYLGADLESVSAQFGKESYRTEVNGRLILTYLSLDTSIVFKIDEEKGTYSCEKILMGTKDTFMGLSSKSSRADIESLLGKPFSSINYKFDKYYDTVFSNLSISLKNSVSAPSDKFIMDSYFIRFYYNTSRTEIKCIEVGSL